jgi:oxygen-dependent protoporphyrinogen oxidase
VVGGGIAGLAAAWELTGQQPDASVTVFEPGPLGGKIATTDFEGRAVDEGADAFLTRVPEAVQLCAELGLSGELVAPAAGSSMVWWGDRLRPLPDGLVLGVPGRLSAIARSGILSPAGALRAGLDLVLPRTVPAMTDRPVSSAGDPSAGDLSVFDLVAGRFGRQVALRLVDPLVGGIHAGRTDELSAAATVPQLLAAARKSRSLLLGLRAAMPSGPRGPIFLTPRGGVGRLVDVLVGRLRDRGVEFVPSAVRSLVPFVSGGVAGGGVALDGSDRFDGVVVAVPAPAAASLLAAPAPEAAAGLRGIQYASVVLTTLAFPAGSVAVPPGINGFLVPRASGHLMTACSFASAKWPHWAAPGTVLLRVSAGRHHDERAMQMHDGALAEQLVEELGAALGAGLPAPRSVRVSRWPAAFPQYGVGHLGRVAALEASLRSELPSVALAGAAYRGSGIPACIGSGRRAAGAFASRSP